MSDCLVFGFVRMVYDSLLIEKVKSYLLCIFCSKGLFHCIIHLPEMGVFLASKKVLLRGGSISREALGESFKWALLKYTLNK